MKKLSLIMFTLGLISSELHAYGPILSRANDNLDKIAKRYYQDVSYKYNSIEDYKKDLMKWNEDITDWTKVAKEKVLFVYYPYSNYIGEYALPEKDQFESLKEKSSMGLYYNFLSGDYSRITGEEEIESTLTYPITLGLRGEYYLNNSNGIELDIGWKSAVKNKLTYTNVEVTDNLSKENTYNAHLYYKKYFLNKDLNIFAGYDYDSYDTIDVISDQGALSVTNAQTKYHFGTMGIGYNFYLFDLNFYTQLKYQQSISGSRGNEIVNNDDFKPSANKTQFLFSYKSYSAFSIDAFYDQIKIENSNGPATSYNQFGAGIGFSFY